MNGSKNDSDNAEYKNGYDAGRTDGAIHATITNSFIRDFINADTYWKGYDQGRKDRKAYDQKPYDFLKEPPPKSEGRSASAPSSHHNSGSHRRYSSRGSRSTTGSGSGIWLVLIALGFFTVAFLDSFVGRQKSSPRTTQPSQVQQPLSPIDEERRLGLSRSNWASIQLALKIMKYTVVVINGLPGPSTRSSILNWQKNTGQPVTGHISREQYTRMMKALDRDIKMASSAISQHRSSSWGGCRSDRLRIGSYEHGVVTFSTQSGEWLKATVRRFSPMRLETVVFHSSNPNLIGFEIELNFGQMMVRNPGTGIVLDMRKC